MAITGAKTLAFEQALLNHVFRGEGTLDQALHIGLVTGTPTVTDLGASTWHTTHEVAANKGYTRQALTDANMATANGNGVTLNSAEINFGTSTGVSASAAEWGTVTGFIISTDPTIGNATTYYYGIFDTEKSVAEGDSVRITANNLSIDER